MAHESLYAFARPDIPQLGRCVTCAGYENILIGREGQAARRETLDQQTFWLRFPGRFDCLPHDVSRMIIEFLHPRPSLDVPQHAGHVPRARHDLSVIDEPTTTQVTRMRAQLSRHLGDLTQRLSGIHTAPSPFERID